MVLPTAAAIEQARMMGYTHFRILIKRVRLQQWQLSAVDPGGDIDGGRYSLEDACRSHHDREWRRWKAQTAAYRRAILEPDENRMAIQRAEMMIQDKA